MKDGQVDDGFAKAFEVDVPEHLQEDVLTRIVEAIWDEDGTHEGIEIHDVHHINVLNRLATGSIIIEGREHVFEIRDGNNAGTEILSWNETMELKVESVIPEALVPHRARLEDAVRNGRARKFLEDWNTDLVAGTERGDVLHDLLQKRAHDRFFDPGPGGKKYSDVADKYGYGISDEPLAKAARKILHFHAYSIAPTFSSQANEAPMETLERWNAGLDPSTELGAQVKALRERVAKRLSQTRNLCPSFDEEREMEALGFRFAEPLDMRYLRFRLLRNTFRLEAIEGFDPEDLPQSPIAELFQALDPNLVATTRVNPVFEASRIVFQACDMLARGTRLDLSEDTIKTLAAVGMRAVRVGYPEPAASLSPHP